MKTVAGKSTKKKHGIVKIFFGVAAVACWVWYHRLPRDKKMRLAHTVTEQLHTTSKHVVDFLFPHERNSYQPKVFQAHTVKHLLLVVVVVKIALLSTLFIAYPNLGSLQQDIRSQMYSLINEYRSSSGVTGLSINTDLELAAQAKANDMVAQNYFSHFGPDGKKPWQWLNPATYNFKAMGENLAMDFLTAGSVFKAFQKSPTHDKNLVNPSYREIGIAITNGYVTDHDTNLMVVFFGTRKDAPPVAPAKQPLAVETSPQAAPQPAAPPVTQPTKPEPNVPAPKPTTAPVTQPAPQVAVPAPVVTTSPSAEEPKQDELIVRKVAEGTPDIEVLGEAVAAENGIVTHTFENTVVVSSGSKMQRLIAWSDRFFMAFLLTLIVLLAINIIVKIRVQHAHIIANAVILIIVVAGALYLQVHEVEAMGEQIRILGSLFLR